MSTLILTAFPNFFEKGSVYAMHPFYTPKESKNIFTKLGTADKYSFDLPKYRGVPRPVASFRRCVKCSPGYGQLWYPRTIGNEGAHAW